MKMVTLFVALLLLGGCAIVPLGYGHRDHGDTWSQAKAGARLVNEPNDIPPGYKDCTGSHRAFGEATKTERGVSVFIQDTNSRRCPDIKLN